MDFEQFENGFALVIGVGRDLPVTVKDAEGVAGALGKEQLAGYPPDQVRLLTEGQATRSGILQAL
jgi:hypothetical protein